MALISLINCQIIKPDGYRVMLFTHITELNLKYKYPHKLKLNESTILSYIL